MAEAEAVCAYVDVGRGAVLAGARAAFLTRFAKAASPGFDPDVHLRRIGVANQTTMLARESLAIGEVVGRGDGACLRCGVSRGALPHLRHDLLGDAGSTGCRERAPRRSRSTR